MYLSRKKINSKDEDRKGEYDMEELKLSPLVNRVMDIVMRVDQFLIKLGLSLPVGGTLFVVASQNSNGETNHA